MCDLGLYHCLYYTNPTDIGIHSDHDYLDTLGQPSRPTLIIMFTFSDTTYTPVVSSIMWPSEKYKVGML